MILLIRRIIETAAQAIWTINSKISPGSLTNYPSSKI